MLRNFARAKPRDNVLFTTDCMAAAGAPGRYRLGALHTVAGADGIVRQPGGKRYFAASALTMDAAAANVIAFSSACSPSRRRPPDPPGAPLFWAFETPGVSGRELLQVVAQFAVAMTISRIRCDAPPVAPMNHYQSSKHSLSVPCLFYSSPNIAGV